MSGAVALIPARGGSKRIPRKNVRPFLGVPAITRVIDTLQRSEMFDRILVSTDDPEIAEFSAEAGADVPALRPSELAGDEVSTVDVVRHAIRSWLSDLDERAVLWTVYPTAFLLKPEILELAWERFVHSEPDFLIPVLRYPHPVERRLRMTPAGVLIADEPLALRLRSQDLEPAFHDAGQFYVGTIGAWMASTPLADGQNVPFELPAGSAIDVDEPDHWVYAERLARARDL